MSSGSATLSRSGTRERPALPKENLSGHTKKLRYLLEHLERFPRGPDGVLTLLDFGCGNGSAVSRFLMLPGVRYHGVDIHPASLSHARERYGSESATFTSELPDAVVFDVLVYADILEHLDDPAATLREHAARLAPGGLLLGSVPNGYGPFENEKRLDRWLKISAILDLPARVRRAFVEPPPPDPGALPYNAESGHVQFFTRGAIERLLSSAGFEIFDFRNGAFAGAPASERYVLRGERIARANARVADWMPWWAVSTWLFAARKP
jgi:SAM-dependent methyltransferase